MKRAEIFMEEMRWPMKRKVLALLAVLSMVISIYACQQKKETEKKGEAKKEAEGFLVNFKPNDTPDLIPANSFYIRQSAAQIVGGQPKPIPTDEKKEFCLDVVGKEIRPAGEVTFQLQYNPEYIQYERYKPGEIFEKKGKPIYQVGLQNGQKGRLAVKISYGTEGGEASGTGKVLTLCYQAQKPSRADLLFENGEVLDPQKKKIPEVNWIGGLLWILEVE
jgi:hypothetical protein